MNDKLSAEYIDSRESSINERNTISDMISNLQKYDVISFDIFDTAILRLTSNPRGIFSILASEMAYPEFAKYRNKCEQLSRDNKYKNTGSKEVTIDEIYDLLNLLHGIDKKWMDREIELEIALTVPNPYVKTIYDQLAKKKTIVFSSNMYLPREIIEKILKKCGYNNYDKLFLSNELNATKEDGSLQKLLLTTYGNDKQIIHIGDNFNTDVSQSEKSGIDALYYENVRTLSEHYRNTMNESPTNQLISGLIGNKLHNGIIDFDEHWEIGYKIGGPMVTGFCGFIRKIYKLKNIDKILFCARDCEVIHNCFKQICPEIPSDYLLVSRFSLFNITLERSIYDFISRSFESRIQKKEKLTISESLKLANLDYLINECSMANEQLTNDNINEVKTFLINNKLKMIEHNSNQISGAIQYFKQIVGDSKNILVVDLGWSGSCITIFKYFVNKHISSDINIQGALMYGNNNSSINLLNSGGEIDCYVTSANNNKDLSIKQYDSKRIDSNNIFIEYLFASPTNSLLAYHQKESEYYFEYNTSKINTKEIESVQNGIINFVKEYNLISRISKSLNIENINPYTATSEFYSLLPGKYYDKIFSNYLNEKVVSKYEESNQKTYSETFLKRKSATTNRQRILLISPSFSYTGACYSLLRISKILLKLGYYIEVWSETSGGLISEYKNADVNCKIISRNDYNDPEIVSKIKKFDASIINTIVLDKEYEVVSRHVPTIWFIREATNIPEFCKNNPNRMKLLKKSKDIYCVSEYAAEHIRKYNPNIKILKNAVEDLSHLKISKTSDKIRFIQMGTVEKRKGFDIFIQAYLSLPDEYRKKSEIIFAGRCLSGPEFKNYWEPLLELSKKNNGITFLGEIKGTQEKIKTISQADVVVVASLDEACSLVALEGAMMSKPLIVTKNVGAKYIVSDDSGYVIDTNSVSALCNAMKEIMDRDIEKMGAASRTNYEHYASMDQHEKEISSEIINKLCEKKNNSKSKKISIKNIPYVNKIIFFGNIAFEKIKWFMNDPTYDKIESFIKRMYKKYKSQQNNNNKIICNEKIIVSLTSFPGRIDTVHKTIKTILNQSFKADAVILWLAKEQFPQKNKDLPKELLELTKKGLTICWCEDYKSYKKLIPCIDKYPNDVIVTADDDVYYPNDWLYELVKSYVADKRFVYCHRATKITYSEGKFTTTIGGRDRYPVPSYLSKLTGVGGVLYPPKILNKDISNPQKFKNIAPTNDDLWFWSMAILNNVRIAVVEHPYLNLKYVEGTQEKFRLSRLNDDQGLFWKDFNSIMEHYPEVKEKLIAEQFEMEKYTQASLTPTSEKTYSYYKNLNPDLYPYELSIWFKNKTGYYLDLENPQTYDEKIQWLKLYAPHKELALLTDKYLVRNWVKQKIGEQYLIPLLGVWDSADDINFDSLPDKFVLKCNHGCTWNIIVTDKTKLNIDETKKQLTVWMHTDFSFNAGFELHYSLIEPKIIAEKYIENEKNNLYDYKFWCTNGKIISIMFLTDRNTGLKMSFYDKSWNVLPYVYNYERHKNSIKKPDNLDKMIKLAETLAEGFPHVRIDLYRLNTGEIFFGEMTFTSMSGVCKWDPPEWDRKMGDLINITEKMKRDKDKNFSYIKKIIKEKYGK